MNRRKFLTLAGSSAIIVAAGGAGFLQTRTPSKALEPWERAGSEYADPMLRALSYAILAPNPHNRQPWIVDLKSPNEAILTCDLDRLLPETDPFSRQIVIGLGCFLELFSIAARQQGHRADISTFPQGNSKEQLDHRPVAILKLEKQEGLVKDLLFDHILDRRTNRNAYDTTRPINSDVLRQLHAIAGEKVTIGSLNKGEALEDLRALTRDAMWTEFKTVKAYRESIELMRIGRHEIEANPDGISLGGPFLETLNLFGMLSRKQLADPTSSAFQTGLDMVETGAMSSMGFVWINSQGNDRPAQIEAGRAYMRLALAVTKSELSMQPMSQALQEYAAMAPYYKNVHNKLTKHPGERVQMLARLGYTDRVTPAPRWPLDTRLKHKLKKSQT